MMMIIMIKTEDHVYNYYLDKDMDPLAWINNAIYVKWLGHNYPCMLYSKINHVSNTKPWW